MADVGKRAEPARPAYAINWEDRPDPKKFEFGAGVELIGILLDVERRTVKDAKTGQQKPAVRYTVRELTDAANLIYTMEPVFFYGTYVLDSKLRPGDIGHFVRIICKGEDKEAGRNGNPMKLFDVSVSKATAPGFANDGSEITDADLPPMGAYD